MVNVIDIQRNNRLILPNIFPIILNSIKSRGDERLRMFQHFPSMKCGRIDQNYDLVHTLECYSSQLEVSPSLCRHVEKSQQLPTKAAKGNLKSREVHHFAYFSDFEQPFTHKSELIMAATASANSLSLTCAFLPRQGFHGSAHHHQSVQLRTQKKQLARKAGSGTITAKFELQPPPYPMDALEPHMSSRTFEFHWGKHHRAYVDNLNKQIDGTELDGKTLEDIILVTYNKGSPLPAFNNAAQAWNHQFFWESMKPNGGGEPSGELLELINRDFGSYDTFVKEFKAAAATQFGSGWAWLAYKPEDKKLALVKTPNAENPLVLGYTPLLTIDVWEHAYYLDFQNRRPDYISIFMEKLVSWEAVSSRLKAATA